MAEPHLRVRMRHRLGPLELDLGFALRQPWTLLFGASGSGKSSVLRAIAGFLQPLEGEVVTGSGEVLFRASDGLFVRPERRPVRSAAQKEQLFPHWTIKENLRFASSLGHKSAEENALFAEVLALFRLGSHGEKWPHELSGGEWQRAAVARAAVAAVTYSRDRKTASDARALLLLDEPFTGLDAGLRDGVLVDLREWLARWRTPVLSVTHDLGEALLLDCEVIRLAEGRIVAQGPAREVLAPEREAMLRRLG